MRKIVKIYLLTLIYFFILNNINILNAKSSVIPSDEVIKLDNLFHENCMKQFNVKDNRFIELYWKCKVDLMAKYIKSIKGNGKNYIYVKELEKIKKIYQFRLEENKDLMLQKLEQKRFNQSVLLNESDGYYFNLIKQKFNTDLIILEMLKKKEINQKELERRNALLQYQIKNKCVKYKINSPEYHTCLIKEQNIDTCYSTLDETIERKKLQNNFDCKKKAINDFPDYMILYNNQYEKLLENKYDEFILDRERDAKALKEKNRLNKLISGPRISKEQLLDLRINSEIQCNLEKEKEIELFRSLLKDQCSEL